MQEFMMIFRNEKTEGAAMPSEEQMQAAMKHWKSWIGEIAAQGKYVGTNRLLPIGKTIKPNNTIIDGPFAEAKEMIGGYLIVKASSLDEAVEMAKSCPNLLFGGNVEVRNLMPIENNVFSENFLDEKILA